jgi:pimeloyl-ACP methyl ester carboxylesterase
MLARRRPDLLSAYVGTGQFVDWARQDALSYRAVLDQARALGDAEAVAELERLGPPPWPDAADDAVVSRRSGALTPGEQAAFAAALPAIQNPPPGARYIAPTPSPADPRARALAAYALLRDELKAFDARALGTEFQIPMLFVQGDLDVYSVTSVVMDYAAAITAPRKATALIEGGGHSCVFMVEPFGARLRDFFKSRAPD